MKSIETNHSLDNGLIHKSGAIVNSCKLCSPLGASMVYKGIQNCIPMLHGSQGCATYIRRYMISHFREPIDIASSNFSESTTIFGGREQFLMAIENVKNQYHPDLIGIASTCLSDTIGEDVDRYIGESKQWITENKTQLVFTSTPSYQGCHEEGYWRTLYSIVKSMNPVLTEKDLTLKSKKNIKKINIISGISSPADLRIIKQYVESFDLDFTLLPDYSETLDNPTWEQFKKIPEGGTSVDQIKQMSENGYTLEFASTTGKRKSMSPADWLLDKHKVSAHKQLPPIGLRLSDEWINILINISQKEVPDAIRKSRGRLLDSMADGHKYVFKKRVVVYGEQDLVTSLCSFFVEIGLSPVIVAIAGRDNEFPKVIRDLFPDNDDLRVFMDADFESIKTIGKDLNIDLVIGHSKGRVLAVDWDVPLVRCGFPIHDRVGGQRLMHYGYEGTQFLFDNIVNALLEHKQNSSQIGYKYM